MALALKPQRPPGAPPVTSNAFHNPRAARAAGFDLLLQELASHHHPTAPPAAATGGNAAAVPPSGVPMKRLPLADVSNAPSGAGGNNKSGAQSARDAKDDALLPARPLKAAPLSAREPNAGGAATGSKALFGVPKALETAALMTGSLAATPAVASNASGGAMSPGTALAKYRAILTAHEQREIADYPDVWYVGESHARKIHATPPAGAGASAAASAVNNGGFDDDKGDYRVVTDDHIGYRYQILAPLGRGSFGQVSKALDHRTGNHVAVKIIKNKKKFHDQALIEVRLLKHLNDRDPLERHHIVRMLDHFLFRSHMVIVFELHSMNLYDLCKASHFAPMPSSVLRSFAKQLLLTLHFTHKERIVHCDLKPENILLKRGSKSQLRVIDFGSSCFEADRLYTYIQSRFYRAPEVMLGVPYTTAIDMWSLGCILAELANGYPIFPGESEVEQMQCVMEVLGTPPRGLLERAPRKKVFFDSQGAPRLTPNSRGKVRRPNSKDLALFLKVSDPVFVDFVKALLAWEPERRLTPLAAMKHPWIASEFDNVPGASPSGAVGVPTSNASAVSSSVAVGGAAAFQRTQPLGVPPFDAALLPSSDDCAIYSARGPKRAGVDGAATGGGLLPLLPKRPAKR